MKILKYVDDGVQVERVSMEMASRSVRDGVSIKDKHAVPSQNVFLHNTSRAQSVGMKINAGKTKILCVSDAQSSLARPISSGTRTRS